MLTRRRFLQWSVLAGAGLALAPRFKLPALIAAQSPDPLEPESIPKYETPLIIPPAMPRIGQIVDRDGRTVDYYEIAVQQFQQSILPPSLGLAPTTVWSYGVPHQPATFNYPAFTVEARYDQPVRVKWINGLVDSAGRYLPHLLPVDQTLHWANPPGGPHHRDRHGMDPTPYRGPVPIVTHVHGAHTTDESDGYTEAWYLPQAANIPDGYARVGTWYDHFKRRFTDMYGETWPDGSAVFQYPNRQPATTMWYHDHSLGITRLNVYAGPAGFYLLRGGPEDVVQGVLPGPAPAQGDALGARYYEIPLAIQDRTFNADGSLFYPSNRAFFEDLEPDELDIPFAPAQGCRGPSDVPPIWNPEFFGNTIVVNGRTWPYLEVEARRYRFRCLNGCNSRFLILKLEGDLPFYQIGAEGGFLPAPVRRETLLIAPAERADVVVDFTNVPVGTRLRLLNLGPDEPFGGGTPDVDFEAAEPETTGQVMQFRVVARVGDDRSTPPLELRLPARTPLGPPNNTRRLALVEEMSKSVFITEEDGRIRQDCRSNTPFGPVGADLGVVGQHGQPFELSWDDPITETPALNATEVWELHNFTVDAHPIHIHEVMFEVVNRESKTTGQVRGPEAWETGLKDTVIAYPDEITRIKARFDMPGRYVWHCHILEHEDNEMMRPYEVGRRRLRRPVPQGESGEE